MAVENPERAKARIQQQITLIGRLRGTGPNPIDYEQWNDRTMEVLIATYGAASPEVGEYEIAADSRGRLPGVRGIGNNMTLNIHGPWGIKARLERSERVLQKLAASL
jgi:hypothetical protein